MEQVFPAWNAVMMCAWSPPAGGLSALQREHAAQIQHSQLQSAHILWPLRLVTVGADEARTSVQRWADNQHGHQVYKLYK